MTAADRGRLLKRASGVLEDRLRELGAPPRADRQVDHVLVDGLTIAQARQALEDVSQGAGGELNTGKAGSPPFCSTESSAALAVNSFAIFAGRGHDDALLSIRVIDPRFERALPIKGVRARVPPTLDVVLQDSDRAVLVESKFLEPWRSEPKVNFSHQYDRVAEGISPGTATTMAAMAAGELRFEALDGAQLLKHLFGIHSGIAEGTLPAESTLLLLYWEPASAGDYAGSFATLEAEFAEFSQRLADQRVGLRSLSYKRLWDGWLAEGTPSWLREHAAALVRRYGVTL